MSDVEPGQLRVRLLSRLLQVLLLPLLIVGVALTVSVYGAIFGLPILLVVWPTWWSARSLRRRPGEPQLLRRVTVRAAFIVAVLVTATGLALMVGLDDLDLGLDLALVAAAAAWVGSTVLVTVGLRRSWPAGPTAGRVVEGSLRS